MDDPRIEQIQQCVEHHSSCFEEVDKRFEQVDKRLEEHTRILNDHSAQFQQVHARLDRHEQILADLLSMMNEGFDRMARHFDVAIEASRSDFRVFKEVLSSHGEKIGTLEGKVEKTDKEVAVLRGAGRKLAVRVGMLEVPKA